jgi:signal transduction histidine kinase
MPGEPRPGPVADGGGQDTALFESFPDPLLAYRDAGASDASGGSLLVRRVNAAFESAFGVDAEALVGSPLDEVVLAETVDTRGAAESAAAADHPGHPATTAGSLLDAAREAGSVVPFERGSDGGTEHFSVRTVAAGVDGGTGYLLFTDVTGIEIERRDLAGRVERLERLLRVAGHDVRNPLEVAHIRLEAARDTGEDVHFEKVEGALDRIAAVVRDVLAAGVAADPQDTVALADVAEAAWETVETGDATLLASRELPTVRGDADRLRRLFENLFRNAAEHGSTSTRPQSGDVTGRASASDQRPPDDEVVEHDGRGVTVAVEPLADGFVVADDGPGIPPEARARAFDVGYSTTPGNSGLGLSIVDGIAREHGWDVSLGGESGGEREADGGLQVLFTGIDALSDGSDDGGSDGTGNPGRSTDSNLPG